MIQMCLLVTLCAVLAACSTTPAGNRSRVVDLPLASIHADLLFDVTTGSRQNLDCQANSKCAKLPENAVLPLFILQVQRVARKLQVGAQNLYPDLVKRLPGMAGNQFDVYVVDNGEPSSACSANGRIAVNSVLGAWHPGDDWVAFLIAREMGHVIARHPEENSAASMATSLLMNIVVPGSHLLKSLFSAGGSQLASTSMRDTQEAEADVIALDLLKASGYQPRNVAVALRASASVLDDGKWSKSFRRSSDYLIAESGRTKTSVASVTRKPKGAASRQQPVILQTQGTDQQEFAFQALY